MLRPLALLSAVLALGLMLTAAVRAAPPAPAAETPERFASAVLVELTGEGAALANGGWRGEHLFHNWYRLTLEPGHSVDAALAAIADLPGVAGVYPDYIVRVDAPLAAPALLEPGDPLFARQWHLPQVQAGAAWDVTDGRGTIVAVLDTGVNPAGADGFCAPLHSEYSALTNSTLPGAAIDRYGHGTHVAGTVAGCAGNGVGVTGLAYGARIMAVKVLGDNGSGLTSNIAKGIVWAADHGAGVINLSLGSSCSANWPACSSAIINDAVAYAAAADVVIVASAGNSNHAYVGQPGNHPEIIAVSATDYARNRASYSSWGAAVDLAAPGGDKTADLNGDGFPDGVYQETFDRSTTPDTWGYYYYNGTSMAAPHVAGAAALLRSCAPEATRSEIRAALESSAADLGPAGWDTTFGSGFLQSYAALETLAAEFGRDVNARCGFMSGVPPCLVMDVVAGPGGVVDLTPDANCDAAGTPGFSLGTVVTATATADAGSFFAGWGGSVTGTANPLVKTIYRDTSLTASFRPCLTVAAAPDGPGRITVAPVPNCGATGYTAGTEVTLTAVPDSGYYFSGWSGGAGTTTNPLAVTLSDDLAVTGSFAACLAVSAGADGPGRVDVAPEPNCAGGAGYNGGSALTLTAVPDAGYVFEGWSGGATGAANPLPLTLTADLDVTAAFRLPPPFAISLFAPSTAIAGFGVWGDEDVLISDSVAGWSVLFDGSTRGLTGDVDALAVLPDGALLISLDAPVRNLPGIGAAAVDDSDVVRFDPATGRYSWYFDGSDVGLTTTGEDVDALALLPDGRLLISTAGAVAVPGITAADEDVLAFTGATGSNVTTGTWEWYIDGSDLGPALGDIDAVAINGRMAYLSSDATVMLGGQAMTRGDIFACRNLTPGQTTRCASFERAWQGTANGLPATANVDALELVPLP